MTALYPPGSAAGSVSPSDPRLNVFINVKSLGAVGDGVADDYAAFVAAVAAAAATSGGGRVYVPDGTYQLSARLDVPSNVKIFGNGSTSTLRVTAGNTTGLIRMRGLSRITVEDLVFDGAGIASILVITDLPNITDVAVGHTVRRCRFTGSTNTCARVANAVQDYRFTDNIIDTVNDGFSFQSPVTMSTGIEVSRNTVRNITGVNKHGLQLAGSGVPRYSDVRICDNIVIGAGDGSVIPIEFGYCSNAVVSGNVIEAGTRGISCGNNFDLLITHNTIKNQTIYAIESGNNTHVTISNNRAYNCAALVHDTGVGGADINVMNNSYVGSGLAAPIVGNSVIKLPFGTGIKIEGNYIRGAEFVATMIRVGATTSNNVTVARNTIVIDTANAGIQAILISTVTDATVEENKVLVSRDLAAGDDSLRVICATMGTCTGIDTLRNEVVFTGAIVAAPNLVGVGTNLSGASTLPRSVLIGNRVINGPVGFVWNATSADTVISDNEARSCTTEWSTINAAVLFIRTKRQSEATAAPTAGAWARGDICWNSTPSASGIPGWMCVTAGTPGTWKAMAVLAA